jgi:thiol:disulfide interchange protein DsbA
MISFRQLLATAIAAVGFAAAGASAQQPEFGLVNPPQPTEGGGKIEVIEFFWYGCPHCARVEPFVVKWVAAQPKDVVFKRVHALPSNAWLENATLFYTLEAMGKLDALHTKVFDAIHNEGANLNNQAVRDAWLTKNGIDPAKYAEVAKSFSVQTKLTRARQMTSAYKVDGVPQFYVNGKYVTNNSYAQGEPKIMPIVEKLVDKVRKEMAAAK